MINDLVKLVIAHPKRYLKFKLINSLVLIATPRAQHPTVEPPLSGLFGLPKYRIPNSVFPKPVNRVLFF